MSREYKKSDKSIITTVCSNEEKMMNAIYMCYYLCVYEELCNHINNSVEESEKKKIYTNRDIRELLSVNDKLIRKYRNDGLLPYSLVGNKYTYSADDIQTFLKRTHLRDY